MFDPGTSEILAELEDGGKELSYLVDKLQISENEIHERLSYLLEHSFVSEKKNDNKIIVTADAEKLAKLVEEVPGSNILSSIFSLSYVEPIVSQTKVGI